MNINNINNIYFIGIGGIGMSAIARYFNLLGKKVAGYDRTSTDITEQLEREGIDIHYEDNVQKIPFSFTNPQDTIVIYTPAIKHLLELDYFHNRLFSVYKRSEILGIITQNHKCLAVAGTHGKTTTSSILAHILVEVGAEVSAFLGGIAENFDSNFVSRGNKWVVVEADEFDRSFLQLSPDIACITSIDSDHLDIYQTEDAVREAFSDFQMCVKPSGKQIVNENVDLPGIKYGFSKSSHYRIENVTIHKGEYVFDIFIADKKYENVRFSKPGYHNLLNALAAFAVAVEAGFEPKAISEALSSFKGVKRRFSYVINTENTVMIDDYAHHPSELDALYQAVKQLYPTKKSTIVFQPHLFSRTRDFMFEFARSLSQFDTVILYDIYPAREEPIQGVCSEELMKTINDISTDTKVQVLSKDEALKWVAHNKPQLLLAVGAGDISFEVERLKKVLL